MSDAIVRSYPCDSMRAVLDGGVLEGHAAVYEQRVNIGDCFYEIIERGAFSTADLDDVFLFVNHDTRKIPLARARRNNGNSTMQVITDEKGLAIKASLDIEKNAEAKALHSAVSRQDITGMSFKFWVDEERWENLNTAMPTRRIIKVKKVAEVSAVNEPAYSGTDIQARGATLENEKSVLENARSTIKLDNLNLVEALKLKISMKAKE